MTTTTSLTDRYVAATLRSLPERQRADIQAELRASIADAIDDRLESGEDPAGAELAVLAELGEPTRLAAGYAQRPLHLIGPAHYLDYARLLKVLVSTVVPIVFVVVGLVDFLGGSPALTALGLALYSALEVAMTVAFGTTLAFAVIERMPSTRAGRRSAWDPRALRELPDRRGPFSGLIGGLGALVVIATGLVLWQTLGFTRDAAGDPIGPIAEELWESGALYVALFFAVASISFHVAEYYTGWGVPNAIANAILAALFAATVLWISAASLLLNPEYFTAVGWENGHGVVSWIVVVVIILLWLTDTIDGFARAGKARSAA